MYIVPYTHNITYLFWVCLGIMFMLKKCLVFGALKK